eukprot:CAMPEP_0114229002 /NCGR_PEP_ID=MMETSP0058-20121206/2662_1 /TAXON_ID=36894 /ORGANISM="Pyramimonas parkeae, CCMP726" /LENGTH=219 /DNA_ID=CAMNT_0001340023 /DNA_START=722 /DNA_END=1382 /DNA_ORIENTATION=-
MQPLDALVSTQRGVGSECERRTACVVVHRHAACGVGGDKGFGAKAAHGLEGWYLPTLKADLDTLAIRTARPSGTAPQLLAVPDTTSGAGRMLHEEPWETPAAGLYLDRKLVRDAHEVEANVGRVEKDLAPRKSSFVGAGAGDMRVGDVVDFTFAECVCWRAGYRGVNITVRLQLQFAFKLAVFQGSHRKFLACDPARALSIANLASYPRANGRDRSEKS